MTDIGQHAAKSSSTEDRTPAENTEYRTTPDYSETLVFLDGLARAHSERVRVETFGRSGEGRELKVVIVSNDACFTPEQARDRGRAVLLVQNSIHAGEMDGKDACLALLRDLLADPALSKVLDHLVWLFVPVYNVDGHERRSPYNRVNQNGPDQMGWRANATNLNLNRDYMKADAPETRAFLRLFHRWLPDFFVDDHVTDGADFQYDVTFQLDTTPDVAPSTGAWIRERVSPELVRQVDASGHLAFPNAVFLKDSTDPARGLAFNENPPRFSTGFMILENRPGLLVELHMLKDYRTRVLANYELLRALLVLLDRESPTLVALNREADAAAERLGETPTDGTPFPLVIETSGRAEPVRFRGVRYRRYLSGVSGAVAIAYDREPWETTLPSELEGRVAASVVPPVGYIIPPQYVDVIDVLEAHGVRISRTREEWSGEVGSYLCTAMRWPTHPFEGRFPILRGGNVEQEIGHFGECRPVRERRWFPAGSAVVLLDQRLSKVVVHWLEPEAPDSALRWGFFASMFEQKEYGDAYVLEKLAASELERNASLRTEFEARLEVDPAFAASPSDRLSFFYERSPWGRANRVGAYPVGRLLDRARLPPLSAATGTDQRS